MVFWLKLQKLRRRPEETGSALNLRFEKWCSTQTGRWEMEKKSEIAFIPLSRLVRGQRSFSSLRNILANADETKKNIKEMKVFACDDFFMTLMSGNERNWKLTFILCKFPISSIWPYRRCYMLQNQLNGGEISRTHLLFGQITRIAIN